MKSAKSLCKKLLNFKNTVITGCEFYTDADKRQPHSHSGTSEQVARKRMPLLSQTLSGI